MADIRGVLFQRKNAVFFLHGGGLSHSGFLLLPPHVDGVGSAAAKLCLFFRMGGPQLVYGAGELEQLLGMLLGKELGELLFPVLDLLNLRGDKILHDLIGVFSHACIRQEEVVDLFSLAFFRGGNAYGRNILPRGTLGSATGNVAGRPHLTPCSHQRVAAGKLVAKPRHKPFVRNGVEPQADLGKLHRNGVKVHAEGVVV